MDSTPNPFSGGPSSFSARINAQQRGKPERARQLCGDLSDFCDTIHFHLDTLHSVYSNLPDPSLRYTLAPIDEAVQKMRNNAVLGRDSANDLLRKLDVPGPDGKLSAELALQKTLWTIPSYLYMVETMEQLLRQSIPELQRINREDAQGNKKLGCLAWIMAAQPAAEALRNEVDSMKANAILARGDSAQLG